MQKLIKLNDQHYIIVDDSEIKEGDYHVAIRIVKTNGDKAIAFTDQEQLDAIAEIGGAKKIIAHLPLNNSPILQGVDLLPPLEQEDDVEEFSNSDFPIGTWSSDAVVLGLDMYKTGYNKAKEKYKYTEADIWKAYMSGKHGGATETHYEFEEIIQSLSQPKIPIGFECQTFDTGDDKLDGTHVLGIRTTTNSQGQSVWVGEYIYA